MKKHATFCLCLIASIIFTDLSWSQSSDQTKSLAIKLKGVEVGSFDYNKGANMGSLYISANYPSNPLYSLSLGINMNINQTNTQRVACPDETTKAHEGDLHAVCDVTLSISNGTPFSLKVSKQYLSKTEESVRSILDLSILSRISYTFAFDSLSPYQFQIATPSSRRQSKFRYGGHSGKVSKTNRSYYGGHSIKVSDTNRAYYGGMNSSTGEPVSGKQD